MKEPTKAFLTTLYESYEDSNIKHLIDVLSQPGFPAVSMVESKLGSIVTKIKADRLHTFFDELNSGDVVLSPDQIESNDFLHAYFSTVDYVLKTRSNRKIVGFARILKNLYTGNIGIDMFEDYTAIFSELSDREFAILALKHSYEIEDKKNASDLNPRQLTSSSWDVFVQEACDRIGISEDELDALLVRVRRTGCYIKPVGYWENGPNQTGHTTELFKRILDIIEMERLDG